AAAARLQDGQPLRHDDGRLPYGLGLTRDDGGEEMRIDRRRDLGYAGLDVSHELQQPPHVVAFRKALALRQPSRVELPLREEEAVGRDQIDLRMARPPREQRLQDARR